MRSIISTLLSDRSTMRTDEIVPSCTPFEHTQINLQNFVLFIILSLVDQQCFRDWTFLAGHIRHGFRVVGNRRLCDYAHTYFVNECWFELDVVSESSTIHNLKWRRVLLTMLGKSFRLNDDKVISSSIKMEMLLVWT